MFKLIILNILYSIIHIALILIIITYLSISIYHTFVTINSHLSIYSLSLSYCNNLSIFSIHLLYHNYYFVEYMDIILDNYSFDPS